jgi:signal transduction histidine kinase
MADSNNQASVVNISVDAIECQACHQYSSVDRPRVVPIETPSKGWRISAPVENLPQCYGCHDPGLSHLGILLMDVSLTGKQTQLNEDLKTNLLISVISTGVVSLLVYILIQQLVVSRIELFRKPINDYANGQFNLRFPSSSSIDDEINELANTFNQMAKKLEQNSQEEIERQKLREQAISDERERIARELHDGFAQVLGYVNTKVMAARLLLKKHKFIEAENQLEHLEQAARGLFVDVREAILGLKMSGQQDKKLIEALKQYAEEYQRLSGISTEFSNTLEPDVISLNPKIELNIFRIVQEALNNIRKHSEASKVRIKISKQNGFINCQIKDNGVGFILGDFKSNQSCKFGLSNMYERADEIGAKLDIKSNPGTGTQINLSLGLEN